MTDEFKYIDFDEAVWLHFELMWFWSETHFGIDRKELIESALARPRYSAIYEAADIVHQAATLCYGFVKNHPWRGGNKRTATHLMRYFLAINGFDLNYTPNNMYEMVLAVESDTWKVDEIDAWIRERIVKID